MAAPNNSNNATPKTGTLGVGLSPTPPKSQRGHNKPKCKQCGNVARSRCPYECCKRCCSRNQNPCHIHVKGMEFVSFVVVDLLELSLRANGVEQHTATPCRAVMKSSWPLSSSKATSLALGFLNQYLELDSQLGDGVTTRGISLPNNGQTENGVRRGWLMSFSFLVELVLGLHCILDHPPTKTVWSLLNRWNLGFEVELDYSATTGSVLKANSTFPDKTPSSGTSALDHQPLEPPQSTSAGRVASLRQLSNSFAQFNNLHLSLRSKKPLTRKDAAAINEWRFAKLKEYKERNVEVENEAFDRYMKNVDLLEEVLAVKPLDDDVSSALESNPTPMDNNETMIPGLKLQLRSNSMRSDGLRMKIQQIVDEGLKKLERNAVDGGMNESIDDEDNKASKRGKGMERLTAVSDLMDKINKARSEEDLKSCLEMKSQLFNLDEGSSVVDLKDNEVIENQTTEREVVPAKELDYSLPKFVTTTEIDQETLSSIDIHLSSLEDVEQL
ncbi:unnamed protein product [Sphenostylis stenocarpa]|uniref:Uncharacterized protein n=1 Tax=Sphenostylis stenocarpa TaxID=92480 RepID=A0AA86VDY3_9FABA|nr:unnamed protein product [Sphenostylis stenocarpa]